jgi:hypothetical protein
MVAVVQSSARGVAILAIALIAVACGAASPSPPDVHGGAAKEASLSPIDRPAWRAGDRWTYEWTAGSERGTKTAEVIGVREVSAVRYYIVRLGDVDQYYTIDFHWAAAVRDGKVEMRMSPPQPWFVWPLGSTRRWVHEGTWEDREGKRATKEVFSVVGLDTVEVPAGRFSAVKVVRDAGPGVADEYWYVPAIRWHARWIGRRNDVSFEERLIDYRLARPQP